MPLRLGEHPAGVGAALLLLGATGAGQPEAQQHGQQPGGAATEPHVSVRTGPAAATTGCEPGTPEPSRRPVASGRSTAAPLAAAARAGPRPTQAKTRASSPLRKRWQRTPPVPRPLAGYSENGVTFTAPGSVPGSAAADPRRGDHDRGVVDLEGAEGDDPLPGGEPDAGDPAAGAALRPHLAGAEVQQLGVGGDEAELLVAAAQLDRADHLVAVGEPDHLPGVPVAEQLRVDPLDDALPGAEGVARACRSPGRSARAPARPGPATGTR